MDQIAIKVPDDLREAAETAAKERGYMDLSEFVRQAIRDAVEKDGDAVKEEGGTDSGRLLQELRDMNEAVALLEQLSDRTPEPDPTKGTAEDS